MDLVSRTALRVATRIWNAGPHGFGLTVVCKATFTLAPELSPLAPTQVPVQTEDVVAGPAGALSRASDLAPFKHLPEAVVVGHAFAPSGKPAPSLVARLAAGGIDKSILVVGDRRFEPGGRLTEPVPFTRMPLVWERAAGGAHTSNPAGRLLGASAPRDAKGCIQAPNFFAPGAVLTTLHDAVEPVGLGPLAPLWPARAARLGRNLAGWAPDRWHARPMPADIDPAHFNAAPADQRRAAPFGGEPLHLENLHPRLARLSTRLAPVTPAATVDRGTGPEPLPLRCDTLVVDTDLGVAMLVWRGHTFLDQPEAPARVVVTGPAAPLASADPGTPAARIPAWAYSLPASETLAPGWSAGPPAPLPFARPPAPRSPLGTLPMIEPAPPAAVPAQPPAEPLQATADLGIHPAGTALPFAEDAAGRVTDREDTAVLRRAPAIEYEESASPVPGAARATLSAVTAVPRGPAWATFPGAPRPGGFSDADQEQTTEYVRSIPIAEEAPPAASGPVDPLPGPDAPLAETAGEPAPGVAPQPGSEAAPRLDLDAYSAARCGAIAARLACDGPSAAEILSVEGLDAASWQEVHERRRDAIRDEVARGKKALLTEYDTAYVQVLEALRGVITVEAYAAIAEAAERGAEGRQVTDRGLPEGAWPHVHRVWIQRMVRDVRLGKQVRAAIEALRSRGGA